MVQVKATKSLEARPRITRRPGEVVEDALRTRIGEHRSDPRAARTEYLPASHQRDHPTHDEATVNLTKRHLITDDVELKQYDFYVSLSEAANREAETSPSYRLSVRALVWPLFDAYRRMSAMETPPDTLFLGNESSAWPALRKKFAAAAEAYEELLTELARR